MTQREPENLAVRVGRRVRELRMAKGLPQAELARAAGMQTSALCNTELAEWRLHGPQLMTLHRIAKALGVKTRDLIPED